MLELKHVQKRYDYQKVLDDISIVFPDAGMIAIVGPSGCGKSTLLNIMGGIDKEFTGDILYNGESVKKHLSSYRKKHVSFIFQKLHLIMWLSVQENITLSQYFHKQLIQDCHLDIANVKDLKIKSLSIGQRQRLAYLRACCQYKNILLCDEPTGSLDQNNAEMIMKNLQRESENKLVIVVSHDLKLVQKYCDEIYEMKDGNIIHHQVYHQVYPSFSKSNFYKKKRFSFLLLSFHSLMAHKKRTIQMIVGFSLALLCILFTLTLSMNLEDKIYEYIYSLIPPSSISVQNLQNSFDSQFVEELENKEGVLRVQLFLEDYEHLGIGFKGERYQSSQVLFIGDDTMPFEYASLEYGRYPVKDQEILVSKSTAQHLCGKDDIHELVDKKIYSWYKHGREMKNIVYHVVGITDNTTTTDTLYQRTNAYIRLLDKQYDIHNHSIHMGLVFIEQNQDIKKVLSHLKYEYPQYKFIETGASTKMQVSSTLKKIKIILYIFSFLALLSSLFLIGEVMFLNSLQKKKDYAIMTCFGAGIFDFFRMILYESLDIIFISIFIVLITYIQIIYIFNTFLKKILLNESFFVTIDYSLMLLITLLAFFLVLLSQIPPMIYIKSLNTIEALKD